MCLHTTTLCDDVVVIVIITCDVLSVVVCVIYVYLFCTWPSSSSVHARARAQVSVQVHAIMFCVRVLVWCIALSMLCVVCFVSVLFVYCCRCMHFDVDLHTGGSAVARERERHHVQ